MRNLGRTKKESVELGRDTDCSFPSEGSREDAEAEGSGGRPGGTSPAKVSQPTEASTATKPHMLRVEAESCRKRFVFSP